MVMILLWITRANGIKPLLAGGIVTILTCTFGTTARLFSQAISGFLVFQLATISSTCTPRAAALRRALSIVA
ncbi:hypothetical protein D3C72_2134030 [compost metagenome]